MNDIIRKINEVIDNLDDIDIDDDLEEDNILRALDELESSIQDVYRISLDKRLPIEINDELSKAAGLADDFCSNCDGFTGYGTASDITDTAYNLSKALIRVTDELRMI